VLPQRLKEARKRKKLTQEELANLVNTKNKTISNYETGYSTPSNDMLDNLADVLDVSVDWLLGRTDVINNEKIELTEEEREILKEISKLPKHKRQRAWEQLEMFVQYEKIKESK
jgi:transcriptional regulator with XRE-family HTH domain